MRPSLTNRTCNVFTWMNLACVWLIPLTGMACAPPANTVQSDIQIDTDDVDTLLDRYTDSHKDAGSDMQLLITNEDAYEGFRDVIVSAESTINIETLYFDNDEGLDYDMGLEFAQLLADKATEGVQVRLIIDDLTQGILGRPEIEDTLRQGGVQIINYASWAGANALDYVLYHNHKKMLIADGKRAIIGGSNYGARYMAPNQWRDTNVLLTGPVVTTIQREFLDDWTLMGGSRPSDALVLPALDPSGALAIRSIEHRPAQGDYDINDAVLIALRLADEFVLIEAPYVNPTDWLLDELIAAADRGVDISILTNSQASMDVEFVYPVVSSWFETLLNHNIHVYLWDLPARTMHSKAMVVDDTLAMVGTYNFNARSILWDSENMAVFTDASAIGDVNLMIQQDLSEPHVYEIDFDWLQTHYVGDPSSLEWPILIKQFF